MASTCSELDWPDGNAAIQSSGRRISNKDAGRQPSASHHSSRRENGNSPEFERRPKSLDRFAVGGKSYVSTAAVNADGNQERESIASLLRHFLPLSRCSVVGKEPRAELMKFIRAGRVLALADGVVE
jgi:hypothetical protein